MTSVRPKLLFFVAVDWFFCSHFLSRAVAAQRAGYDVVVLTRVIRHGSVIESAGLRLIPLEMDRRSLNPWAAVKAIRAVYRIYKDERPVLIHQVAMKPIVFGGIAARLAGLSGVVNAVVGGGYAFTSTGALARLIRPVLIAALKRLLNPPGSKVVFENADDLDAFTRAGFLRSEDGVLIRGAGVDVSAYRQGSAASATPLVVVAARLLWDKGIGEFVDAARLLRASGIKARFVVVGDIDPGNRAAIDEGTLAAWREEGVAEFWGFREDMPAVLAQASISCLPSYREGLPKALLEAMAAGLPCVTTDVPGCREAVRHGDNGLLVPARDPQALADALKQLISDQTMRQRMGERGRARAVSEFSSEWVVQQTLGLYQRMLGS